MKYLKLNNIYKLKDSTIIIDFFLDSNQKEIFINDSNIKILKKCRKEN